MLHVVSGLLAVAGLLAMAWGALWRAVPVVVIGALVLAIGALCATVHALRGCDE